MKRGRAGKYVRDGMSVEVIRNVFDTHGDVLLAAKRAFKLKEKADMALALFTLSGAMIPESDEWTLHSYLEKIHKSEARLGIGYVEVNGKCNNLHHFLPFILGPENQDDSSKYLIILNIGYVIIIPSQVRHLLIRHLLVLKGFFFLGTRKGVW